MTKEFVTYEQALALKELGFDEHCLCHWYKVDNLTIRIYYWQNDDNYFDINGTDLEVTAPFKSQVFRWFREKYAWYANISSWIHEPELGTYHEYEIYGTPDSAHGWTPFKTYEEAENACIDKLIEIAKQQDNEQ
jgi:hypothetical protein